MNKTNNIFSPWMFWAAAIIIALVCAYAISANFLYGIVVFAGIITIIILSYIIFKNPFWGIILITFFLPFERIPSIDLGFMNIKINQIIGGMIMIYFFISVMAGRTKIRPFSLTWPLVIFYLSIGASLISATYFPRAILIFAFVVFTSLFMLLYNQFLTDKEKLITVVKVIFLSSCAVALFSFFQFFGDIVGLPNFITGLDPGYSSAVFGFPRIQAFSQEPLYLGNFLLLPLGIFIVLFLGKVKEKIIPRIFIIAMILVLLIILGLTVSRGAYLAFAIMMFVIFIFMARKFFTPKIIATIILIMVIGIAAIFWFVGKGEDKAINEFVKHVTVQDLQQGESVQGRLIEFERAFQIAQKNPLTGIGIGNYGVVKKGNLDPATLTEWDIVNNQYIELYAETGIIGLVGFAILIIFILWRSIIAFYACKDLFVKYILLGMLAAFVGILVQYNFFSTLYIIPIWVLMGLLVATQNIAFKHK